MAAIGYDAGARKRPTNLSVNEDLMAKARELGINVSAFLEDRLGAEVAARQRDRLQGQIDRAVDGWNAYHADHGSPADEYLDL